MYNVELAMQMLKIENMWNRMHELVTKCIYKNYKINDISRMINSKNREPNVGVGLDT